MRPETLFQKQVFEIYYSLGKDRSLVKLREKLKSMPEFANSVPSLATLGRWSQKYNWQLRIQQRDLELAKKMSEQVNQDILDEKAEYRKLIKIIKTEITRALRDYQRRIIEEGRIPIEIKSVRDLKEISLIVETLIKLDMSLMGEVLESFSLEFDAEIRELIEKLTDKLLLK